MTDTRTVTPDCERPARMDGTCFYCREPVGGQHRSDCVAWTKRVRIRFIAEYEVDVPHHWTGEDVEFQRGESSWCMDNTLEELSDLSESLGCLCNSDDIRVEYVGEVTP